MSCLSSQLSLIASLRQLKSVGFHGCSMKQHLLFCARPRAIQLRRNAFKCIPQDIV